jgi:hypothetical protein
MSKTHLSGPLVMGTGDETAAPAAGIVAGPAAVGTNIAGVNLTLQGGQSTGTGAGGSIVLQVSPAGSSGSTANTMVTGLTVGATGLVTFGPTATAGQAVIARTLSLAPTAAANTDLTLALPNCRILDFMERTTTAYTGTGVTVALGSTSGGAEFVAAADIKAKAANRALTQVDAAADVLANFTGGTLFVRIAQSGTPTAVGAGELVVRYIRL